MNTKPTSSLLLVYFSDIIFIIIVSDFDETDNNTAPDISISKKVSCNLLWNIFASKKRSNEEKSLRITNDETERNDQLK